MRDHAWLNTTIVGWKSSVGRWARLEGVSVLGEDVQISDEVCCDLLIDETDLHEWSLCPSPQERQCQRS